MGIVKYSPKAGKARKRAKARGGRGLLGWLWHGFDEFLQLLGLKGSKFGAKGGMAGGGGSSAGTGNIDKGPRGSGRGFVPGKGGVGGAIYGREERGRLHAVVVGDLDAELDNEFADEDDPNIPNAEEWAQNDVDMAEAAEAEAGADAGGDTGEGDAGGGSE